jgi:hypothetical protein
MAMKVIIQAIDQASPVIKNIDREFGAMGDKFNAVSKQIDTDAKAMEARFGKISEAARKTGLAMMGMGAAIIGGLIFLLNRKSKQNTQLKADKSLTVQRESSKVVDSKVDSAQKEIDKLEKEMKTKPKDDDDFWKDYTK